MLDLVVGRMIFWLMLNEPAKSVDLALALTELIGSQFDPNDGGALAAFLGEADRRRVSTDPDPEEAAMAVDTLSAALVGAMAERAAIVAYLRVAAKHNPDCPVAKGAAALVELIEGGAHGMRIPRATDATEEKPEQVGQGGGS